MLSITLLTHDNVTELFLVTVLWSSFEEQNSTKKMGPLQHALAILILDSRKKVSWLCLPLFTDVDIIYHGRTQAAHYIKNNQTVIYMPVTWQASRNHHQRASNLKGSHMPTILKISLLFVGFENCFWEL